MARRSKKFIGHRQLMTAGTICWSGGNKISQSV